MSNKPYTPDEISVNPRGFNSKRNIIIIIIAAILLIGGGITAIAVTSSHSATSGVADKIQLAERYLSEQKYEQAIIEFQKVLEIEPMNVDAYLGLADAYIGLGDTDKALDALREGLNKTEDSRIQDKINEILISQYLEQGRKYLADKEFQKAADEFAKALGINDACVDAYLGEGDAYVGMNNVDKAIDEVQTGWEKTKDESVKSKLDELKIMKSLNLAANYLNEKKFEQANSEFQNVLSIDDLNVYAYIGSADAYIGLEDAQKAIAELRTGLNKTKDERIEKKLNELEVYEYVKKGSEYLSVEKFDEARAEFQKALDIYDKSADAYIGIADAYVGLDKTDEAIKILEIGVDKTQDDKVNEKLLDLKKIVALKLGHQYLNAKKYNDAITEFDKALAIDEMCEEAYIGKSDAYKGLGDNDKAIEILQLGYDKTQSQDIRSRLIELKRSTYLARGRQYLSQKKYDKSAAEFQKVIDVDSSCIDAYLGKADTYVGLGDKTKACNLLYNKWVSTWDGRLSARMFEIRLNDLPLNPQKSNYEPLDNEVNKILSEITTPNMSTYQKVKACFDYLVNNCHYATSPTVVEIGFDDFFFDEGSMFKRMAYDMLSTHMGVCTDYSAAFVALTRGIGLDTELRNGWTGSAGHTWCVLIIDGVEYVFDPQIEDNLTNGYHSASEGGKINYIRFCKTYDELPGQYTPTSFSYMY